MSKGLHVNSETGRLRRVIVHTPGPEVEAMSPSTAEEDLYNDIIPLDIVKEEHAELKGFLASVTQVYELLDILTDVLMAKEDRALFAQLLCDHYGCHHRQDELATMEARSLAEVAIRGLPARHVRLENCFRGKRFDLPPLPNMYFMRDAAAVYRDKSIASAMRFAVRRPEALIHRFIFERHPDFKGSGRLFDGPSIAADGFSLEGGDFQVIAKNTLAIGVSERTSAQAVDAIARSICSAWNEPVSIFAVNLPVARATIHLDMTFTVIDKDACLVFEPVILGTRRAMVARIDAQPGKAPVIREVPSLLDGLKSVGIDLQPILTGGSDAVSQEREQWLSGANSFSFAPGKIIAYSCNKRTLDSLSAAGFEVRMAKDLIASKENPLSFKRMVVGFTGVELARGGGGARCMTCPVERED